MPMQYLIQSLGAFEGNELYIKREDLFPFSFGGNKARKAAHFFREIDEGNYDTVVTYGSSSSNHCRIISNMAAQRNLSCYIISPLEASEPTFNSKMMTLFGATTECVPISDVSDAIKNTLCRLSSEGKKPYFIAGGGHGNLGTQAYVDCYDEIAAYERENGMSFDYIFLATGTGTTQAGLVCGKLMHCKSSVIIGISIARSLERGKKVVLKSIHDYLDANGVSIDEDTINKATEFNDDYISGGYGVGTEAIYSTINTVLSRYGIPLDPTYTGKAFYGMTDYINKNSISGKKILFIHTGGAPLFFDYLSK